MQPPYEGYTWHFTQHAIAFKPETLFGLLDVAWQFRGRAPDSREMSKLLVQKGVLTSNIREDSGQADAWRDYQQVLPELGLMVSTNARANISITPAGLLFLDGSLGFAETLTNQALKYQYPNGFKRDISPEVRTALGPKVDEFANLTELQMNFGVLVKPAVLILRFLLQLLKDSLVPSISIEECCAFVLPIKKHEDWNKGYADLLTHRRKRRVLEEWGRKRNVQDWFKFLGVTDIFVRRGTSIALSEAAIDDHVNVEKLCSAHEDPKSFWIPKGREEDRLTWFAHYGGYDVEQQWVNPKPSNEYVEQNYVEGIETEELEVGITASPSAAIKLKVFDEKKVEEYLANLELKRPAEYDRAKALLNIQEKTRLHEEVRLKLAGQLKKRGYTVSDSAGGSDESVDLLAKKGEHEEVLEVKTVTKRNWRQRFRLGLGQLGEYRYRMHKQTGKRPSAILVFSAKLEVPTWILDFLKEDVRIGLMSYTEDSFISLTDIGSERDIAG